MQEGKQLDMKSGVSIGLVVFLFGGLAYLNSWMARVDAKLEFLTREITRGVKDPWSGRHMAAWVKNLQDMNPEIRIPAVVRENDQ